MKDWQFGSFLQYGSGLPLAPPAQTSANNLGGGEMIRTGAPLFLKDLNCHCINPYTDLVLNRDAWKNPDAGTWGPGPTTLFYSDYRAQRHPSENLNIGRNFRVRERMNLQIRAEFSNIFNRTQLGNPVLSAPFNATNAVNNPTVTAGRYTGGFGVYTIGSVTTGIPSGTTAVPSGANQLFAGPRTGTLIARFTF